MGTFSKTKRTHFPRHQKEESIRNEEPTPYALAAAVTADESGAIDPGDNPVAFFTQLSDAFLEPLPEDMTFRWCLLFLLRCLFPLSSIERLLFDETEKFVAFLPPSYIFKNAVVGPKCG